MQRGLRFPPASGAIRAERAQVPAASGEWTVEADRFSYWLNAVINDPSGRPRTVVHAHAEGELAPDGQAFKASGGSEFYKAGGELLATNHAELRAIRADASQPDAT